MTPELPRAPRSRPEAVTLAASSTVAGWHLRSSFTAVWMVRHILVPVSPSGTGNTLRSLMVCFCWAMHAAPKATICLKAPPLILSVMSYFLLLSDVTP